MPERAKASRFFADRADVKKPAIAAEISQMPIIAVTMARAMSPGAPIKIKVGENTKRTGIIYADQPNRIAAQPVAIAGALAIDAAAKAAIAIGGVIIDIMPKYKT